MVKLLWLADVLHNAEQKVVEVKGWQDRGGQMGEIKGVLLHHTAGPKKGNMPSLGVITNGRPGLKGPLAQLGLARDGTWYVVAAGRSNHAGKGTWKGLTSGNLHLIGVEAENTGLSNDMPWPQVQYDAYAEGVGAILDFLELPAYCAIGHREWAPKRKIDPTFDMVEFRGKVENIMADENKKSLVKEGKPWPEIVEIDPPKAEPFTFGVSEDQAEEVDGDTRYVPDLPKEEVTASFEPWIKEGKTYEEWSKENKKATRKSKPKGESLIVEEPPKGPLESTYLSQSGWKDYQIAALLAQAKVESNNNPNHTTYAVNKQPTSRDNPNSEVNTFGVMNWDKGRTANLDKFVEWYNSENKTNLKRTDKETQYRFIDWELRNVEKNAFKQLTESKELDEALRAAVGYVRPTNWSEDTPESSNKWKDRVIAAYELMGE